MEEQDQVQTLKAALYDASKEIETLHSFLGALVVKLQLTGDETTLDGIMAAIPEYAEVEEV